VPARDTPAIGSPAGCGRSANAGAPQPEPPIVHTREEWLATHDPALIWEGHKAGREIGYCHLEKLCNLEELPPTGFTVSCLPVKIRGGSAGWTREVAILD
jgi:kynurenine formamidase